MNRKYIEELGIKSLRDSEDNNDKTKMREQEQNEYGFDSREVINLDITMIEILYERLKMFLEYAQEKELKANTRIIHGNEMTHEEIINLIINNCAYIIKNDDGSGMNKEINKAKSNIWYYWSIIQNITWL